MVGRVHSGKRLCQKSDVRVPLAVPTFRAPLAVPTFLAQTFSPLLLFCSYRRQVLIFTTPKWRRSASRPSAPEKSLPANNARRYARLCPLFKFKSRAAKRHIFLQTPTVFTSAFWRRAERTFSEGSPSTDARSCSANAHFYSD